MSEFRSTEDGFEIYPSRTRSLLLVLGSVAFTVGCAWLVLAGIAPPVQSLVTLAGVPLFGAATVFYAGRLLRPAPIIALTDDGLYDNSSAISVGFVPWDGIEAMAFTDVEGQTLLEVIVSDFDALLDRHAAPKRALLSFNARFMDEPDAVYVAFDNLGVPADELAAELRRFSGDDVRDEVAA